ncbi:putative protein ASPARTIC PROTEASE IN GUARD CELL 2 isoform X1 [Iris pallida]|uniref:Peptidase A1 domain-containing protein n=1 Tax=Iris pallida TaxID=29817 RepID=A0AAX6H457_IRIPA|nr:putative protein ASPARTIC PROTEASE IN GUARD CELL 2 isoform X1 [Iris pallida]
MELLLLFFFFFLTSLLHFSPTSSATSKYNTLTVTPLTLPPLLDNTDDFSSSSPFSDHKQQQQLPSTSLHFRLAHRDSLRSPDSTPDSLLRLRLARDAARVSLLSSPERRRGGRSGFSSNVTSGLAQGSGEYFTRIGVGTPPVPAFMVLDTGSDIVWLQCQPCRRCYSQTDPIFNPSDSKTFSPVSCSAPLCRQLDVSGCDVRTKSCQYQVSYGDGSMTTGDLSLETLTFRGGARVRNVALGCGHDNEGLFVAAAGLLGLGRGPLSFPTQASRGSRFGNGFSYCLVDRTSSVAANNSTRSSSVVFGSSAVPKSRPVTFTPMIRNPKMDTFYYVDLVGVSVGGSRVSGVLASDLKLDPSTGRGGVIVDSGTSVTRLARPAYAAVREAFRSGAAGLKRVEGGFSLFDTCFDLAGRTEVKVPTLAMHFGGGAKVSLPAENYLIPVDTKGTFCFAFAGTDGGVSIIGNIQQQGFRVVFDAPRSRVGFSPRGC